MRTQQRARADDLDAAAAFYRRLTGAAFGLAVLLLAGAAFSLRGEGAPSASLAERGISLVDEAWVLVAAALVFLMQAGFLCFEVGLARQQHVTSVAIKNILDWTVSTLAFVTIGFGLMFGAGSGLWGSELFLLDGLGALDTTVSGATFFLFQLAFAGTAITIVSGSLVERTTLLAYSLISVVLGAVIYPVFGHWVWGGTLTGGTMGWLADLGFHDFAGGTVVHVTGGTAALVGVAMVGPRIGRFRADGTAAPFPPSNMAFTVLGVVLLWTGWWGFNGGSSFGINSDTAWIILATNIAAVCGLAGSGSYCYFFQDRADLSTKLAGGAIGGLVAITAGADVLSPLAAGAVGLLAGVVYSIGHGALLRLRIDDALGVVPAHMFCGIFGVVVFPILSPDGAFARDRLAQVAVQGLGVAACVAWSGAVSWLAYRLIRATIGLRIDPEQESKGLSFGPPQDTGTTELAKVPQLDVLDERELDELFR